VELVGKVRDRSVCTPELLQNTASGRVRERGKRGIESPARILNHTVQYALPCAGSASPCGATVICCSGGWATNRRVRSRGVRRPRRAAVQSHHLYSPSGRHSSAVEQLFRKSLAVCAVLQAWRADTNGHTYQLFASRGSPSRIDAAGRSPPRRRRCPDLGRNRRIHAWFNGRLLSSSCCMPCAALRA
jgi:hypothetical protein